ncbi:hypothetical protein TRIUR3_13608 [Triticum urartu]|uniref:rRNA-processing protein EFG1 n=1 Tax=Triticum urartu TaxID=4572 RepID=M8AEH8_TRIUA|nr:hypothetical protein TRIUR3_13608 [Triticum urartu]
MGGEGALEAGLLPRVEGWRRLGQGRGAGAQNGGISDGSQMRGGSTGGWPSSSLLDLPNDMRVAQEKKLEELKKRQENQTQEAMQRTIQLRDRKIKFFERRKIERMIRRLDKQQRLNADEASNKLATLREDLEYVRFFPKEEKYFPLFTGGNTPDIVEKRNTWRKQIKENLIAAAANGKDLEETASDDDTLDVSEDDFFMSGSSSDEEADDELTDKSTKYDSQLLGIVLAIRFPVLSFEVKGQENLVLQVGQRLRQRDARVLMPPPRSLPPNRARSADKRAVSSSGNASTSTSGNSFKNRRASNLSGDHNSTLSSNSDAHKPRRKRRPKKKKQECIHRKREGRSGTVVWKEKGKARGVPGNGATATGGRNMMKHRFLIGRILRWDRQFTRHHHHQFDMTCAIIIHQQTQSKCADL